MKICRQGRLGCGVALLISPRLVVTGGQGGQRGLILPSEFYAMNF